MRRRLVAGLVAMTLALGSTSHAAQLPYFPLLGSAYDAVLDARFEAVEPALAKACGPAPPESCDLVRATALWWRIQLDPANRARDAEFQRRIDQVIEDVQRWTRREPQTAAAFFFLGAAYGVRVQWRVLRGQRLAAAQDGKRIKESLEKALELDPSLQDAYFGIGLYRYYADLAPAVLKFFRWLLALPGGDRERGLREMQQARARGSLLRGETDYQLHLIYLWYENRIDDALQLLEELRGKYPHNPLFIQAEAEVHDVYRHDPPAALEAWRRMLELARAGRLSLPRLAEARARVGIAEMLERLHQSDRAIEHLRAVTETRPAEPYGITARAWLLMGEAQDRLGRREAAVSSYKSAIAAAPGDDPEKVRNRARDALGRRPDPRATQAYRLSLEGWRHLERGETARAAAALEQAQRLAPSDPVLHYRLGKLRQAQDRDADALAAFERVITARPAAPATFLASAYLEAARLIEGRDAARAISYYRRAAGLQGADADTRRTATQALARLK